ncbi:SIR2 family protein [Chitinophaga terrae (ex Kim and Jung 2007)]|nr:SIR2 family protein [Chitinophaga terrae (ex Kim and Jung 2007)]GEP93653.1 hypothetical protein CTE07_52980 [Chitinophaga terrae (ex Kim and Jung 2007)]
MEDIKQKLKDHLSQFSTNPYLFVGSGMSRRYLNLPTWIDLLKQFHAISKLELSFEYYLSLSQGKMPKLASVIGNEFHKVWWNDSKFKKSVEKFSKEASTDIPLALKIELCEYLKKIEQQNSEYNEEIELLSRAVVDGIITTNWDMFLNKVFHDYKVYVGQQELLFSESFSVGEIFKIHGSIDKPSSIVVNEEDYKNFNSKYAYLAAKLLTIFVEHPVFFMGYSLTDENVIEILNSIMNCVDNGNVEKIKDRLIFVLRCKENEEPSFQDSQMVLSQGKIIPIKILRLDSFLPLYEVLANLRQRLPVKLLRKLKESVVEYVKSHAPTNKVFVGDIDDTTELSDIEFVIGVGVASQALSSQGYKGIKSRDVIEDVIFNNKGYVAKLLIENTLPEITKGNVFIPVFKYLRAEKLLNGNGTLTAAAASQLSGKIRLKPDFPKCCEPDYNYSKKKTFVRSTYQTVKGIISACDTTHAMLYIPLLDKRNIDLDDLEEFLKLNFEDKKVREATVFRKLVCLYDYLRYGLDPGI